MNPVGYLGQKIIDFFYSIAWGHLQVVILHDPGSSFLHNNSPFLRVKRFRWYPMFLTNNHGFCVFCSHARFFPLASESCSSPFLALGSLKSPLLRAMSLSVVQDKSFLDESTDLPNLKTFAQRQHPALTLPVEPKAFSQSVDIIGIVHHAELFLIS